MAELHEVRAALNELPFHDGTRRALLGNIAEMFPDEDDQAIAAKLRTIEEELRRNDLSLIREEDALFAQQQLRRRAVDLSWLGDATQWAAKITTVALEMALPGVVGYWLDLRLGTGFLALLGVLIGLPLGLWHLLVMTRKKMP